MTAHKDFQVKLVPPKMWHSYIKKSFKKLEKPPEQRFARSALMAMHNRHVGVTPELIVDLTWQLMNPDQVNGVWTAVFRRLGDDLAIGREERRFGLLLRSNPTYTIFRLAMPIVEASCRAIGRCYLFCEDNIQTRLKESDYTDYADELSNQIKKMANSHQAGGRDEFQLFWQERAVTLSTFSRRPVGLQQFDTTLPETDPIAWGFLMRLKPDMPRSRSQSLLPRPLTRPIKHRINPYQKEEGLDGIRMTRREEDIDSILLSEFINPEPVLADRLLNTGYLATQRQSKREKLRDVLIAALMPGDMRASLKVDFVKACWFDCLMRLSLIFRQQQLPRSEFRWIEGDRFNRFHSNALFLQDLPAAKTIVAGPPSPGYRHQFLTALRWLPTYLDSQAHFRTLPNYAPKTEADTSPEKWLCRAWAAQQDHLQWLAHQDNQAGHSRRQKNNQLRVDEFAFVHIMVFLPPETADKPGELPPKPADRLQSIASCLGLGNSQSHNLSLTWLPKDLQDIEGWAFSAPGQPPLRLFKKTQVPGQAVDERKIAGRLERTWLDQIIKEIWHG